MQKTKLRQDIDLSTAHEIYQPYKDRLYKIKMLMRLRQTPSFKNVFRNNLSTHFFNDLIDIADPKHLYVSNTVVSISGETGSGKSLIALSLGLEVFPNFSWENMLFFDQQILDNAHKYLENSLIVRDENPQKGVFGQGSARTEAQFTVLYETCRKAGLSLFLIEPSFMQNSITKYYLDTVDMSVDNRITRVGLRDAKTLNYLGAVYVPVVPEDNKDWVLYNKRKDLFIEKIRRGDLSDAKMDINATVKKLLAEIDPTKYKTKAERRAYLIAKFPSLTTGEINTIHSLLEVELR